MTAREMTIWSYSSAGGNLRQPLILPLETGDAEIIDLVTQCPADWHIGYAACLHCSFFYIALVHGVDLPKWLKCPRCAHAHARPRAHWAGSCEARCDCGAVGKVVFVDEAPDPMPTILRCRRCGMSRARVAPWPLSC